MRVITWLAWHMTDLNCVLISSLAFNLMLAIYSHHSHIQKSFSCDMSHIYIYNSGVIQSLCTSKRFHYNHNWLQMLKDFFKRLSNAQAHLQENSKCSSFTSKRLLMLKHYWKRLPLLKHTYKRLSMFNHNWNRLPMIKHASKRLVLFTTKQKGSYIWYTIRGVNNTIQNKLFTT